MLSVYHMSRKRRFQKQTEGVKDVAARVLLMGSWCFTEQEQIFGSGPKYCSSSFVSLNRGSLDRRIVVDLGC